MEKAVDKTSSEYWDTVFTRKQIAAICSVSLDTLSQWSRRGLPERCLLLLQLYSGEMSLAEWEDNVEELVKEIHGKRWGGKKTVPIALKKYKEPTK